MIGFKAIWIMVLLCQTLSWVAADRIGIVGSGIAGLSMAHYLTHLGHQVEIFEKEKHLGGHALTVEIPNEHGDPVPVDLGFLVFNSRTYPNFIRLLDELGVSSYDTDMSFAVSLRGGQLEWAGTSLWTIFGQWRNFFSFSFWQMLWEILVFNSQATAHLATAKAEGMTLRALLDRVDASPAFRSHYLVPMAQCIWSATPSQILQFPAAHFLQFYLNHGLLQVFDRPQWRTVRGGSREYVRKLTRNMTTHTDSPVLSVRSANERLAVRTANGKEAFFDKVVFATHPPEALEILGPAAHPSQVQVLQNFRYQDNVAILHTDTSFMPQHRSLWASWNFLSFEEDLRDKGSDLIEAPVSLSYWLNNLQDLNTNNTFVETLNPRGRQPENQLLQKHFSHPIFDPAAVAAQENLPTVQGLHGVYFVGAWARWGFHEDGVWSAVQVLKTHFGFDSF